VIFEGSHAFAGSIEVVWGMLQDPDVIAKTTPGTRDMRRVAAERYEGKMGLGLGPFVAEFDVVITRVDVVAPERYTMNVAGAGRLATLGGSVALRLSPDGAATVLHYTADFQVGGPAAALGHRLLESVGQLMARQGLDALSRELTRRLAAQPPPSGPPSGPAQPEPPAGPPSAPDAPPSPQS
jgi:hypothetical protein